MRLFQRTLLTLVLAALSAAPAAALEAGTLFLALQGTSGTADLVAPSGPYLSAYDHGELGVQLQGWYLMDDAWALAVSGGVARTREANEAAGSANRYYQQRAWSARVGMDRVVPVADDVLLTIGPGIEYWSGHANFIGIYPQTLVEAATVTRWSGSARFGALVVLTDSFGLAGHIGFRMGYATASEGGASTGWYTNGHEGAAGVAFAF